MAKFIEEGQAESNNEDEYQSLDPSDEGSVMEQDSTPEPEQQQEIGRASCRERV
jgi:hypothetical protein